MKNLMVLFAALAALLCYCACTPEVKITGDAANPIAINAEINIHIYQHAAEVVDDLYADMDDEAEPEPEACNSSLAVRMLARVVEAFSISSCEAAEAKSQAYETMKALFRETMTKYMKTGYVGENKDGYVTYIGKAAKTDAAVAKAAKEAVTKLNAARKVYYEEEAKKQKVTVAEIQKTFAAAYAAKAKGIWVEAANGSAYEWVKK